MFSQMKLSKYEICGNVSIDDLQSTRVIILDTETTGLPLFSPYNSSSRYYDFHENLAYDPSRIISIAWSNPSRFNMNHIDTKYYLRKPIDFDGSTFSQKALEINGISFEQTLREGIDFREIANQLVQDMNSCDWVVGFNAAFDIHILFNELTRINMDVPDVRFVNVQPYGITLDNWYRKLSGQDPNRVHRSDVDVNKLFECMRRYDRSNKCWNVYKIKTH